MSAEQTASEISQRISQLESLSDLDLKTEMRNLKQAIMENPAACLLLKEEDIGQLVASLRKITGQAISSAAKTTKTREKKETKKFSAQELMDALDEE